MVKFVDCRVPDEVLERRWLHLSGNCNTAAGGKLLLISAETIGPVEFGEGKDALLRTTVPTLRRVR